MIVFSNIRYIDENNDKEQDKWVCNALCCYWYKDESERNDLHCKADGYPDEKPYLLISYHY